MSLGRADTISSRVILAAPQTWLNDGNKLTVSGDITNGANLLTIDGASATTISGVLGNGSGGLTKNGAGQLVSATATRSPAASRSMAARSGSTMPAP